MILICYNNYSDANMKSLNHVINIELADKMCFEYHKYAVIRYQKQIA